MAAKTDQDHARVERFDRYRDEKGEWRWRLLAANGLIVADSAEGYATKRGLNRAIARVREIVAVAH